MPWYRSGDVTTIAFRAATSLQAGTRSSDARDPNGISSLRFPPDLLEIGGKLLAKQDGGVLREGIRALSEALMEMEV